MNNSKHHAERRQSLLAERRSAATGRRTSRLRQRGIAGFMAAVLAGSLLLAAPTAARAAGPCGPPVVNPVACENTLPGNPSSEWDVSYPGDNSLVGFSTDISVNVGGTMNFKVRSTASNYSIKIFRMGWYQGDGARLVDTVTPTAPYPQAQPNCLTDASTGLVDCGNWGVSAHWNVPSTAVSGVYLADLVRNDNGDGNQIVFVVRNDASHSAILAQTSDTTWQAYNDWGGNSLYLGAPAGRAYKVSYNRPMQTRWSSPDGNNFFFGSEFAQIRWMEQNGYDVSYTSGLDTDRSGALLKNHQVFMTSGHDEYWSGNQRANVESARDAGVNMAFFTGNEMFWKTRWEPSIDASATANRTLVAYKETHANAKIDPSSEWTGTWRDPRFSPPSNGGRPENAVSGTLFTVNCCSYAMTVPAADGKLRLWRGTNIATQSPGQVATLADKTMGFEWDEDIDNGFRPAGLFDMTHTTETVTERFTDEGSTVAPGTATHSLTMYRAASGALVFGAGTIQWSWGLDTWHDGAGGPVDPRMQQATVNLFADMGVQPTTLQSGLTPATKSTDTIAPTVTITSPAAGTTFANGSNQTISGTATDTGGGQVAGVEVSTDNGTTWHPATGRASWSYTWNVDGSSSANVKVRAVDDSGNLQATPASLAVTRSCPCTVFGSQTPSSAAGTDTDAVELGMKFHADQAGSVTGVRFYKGAGNTGTHTGSLWSADGTQLATGTFTNESSSGWQTLTFPNPIQISANTTYVVSYFAPNGHYYADSGDFDWATDHLPLHGNKSAPGDPNGLYVYNGGFPTASFQNTNYWVDPVFTLTGDTAPPTVTAKSPAAGAINVPVGTTVTATFSEAVQPASVALTLKNASNQTVAGSVAYDAPSRTATFTPSAALANNVQYTAAASATDTTGNAMPTPTTWTFSTVASGGGTCGCSVFAATAAPAVPDSGDPNAVELGMRFTADSNGQISAIRFYKGAGNTGTHTGSIWSTTGTRLATVTFSGETATGWQQASLSSALNVTAGTTYIVSYHAPVGHYSVTLDTFTNAGIDNPPLHAPKTAAGAGNGVYSYGASAFPNGSYRGSNYWVDVVYSPTVVSGPPTVTAKVPAPGATNVPYAGTVIQAGFDRSIQAGSTVMTLTGPGGSVAGTVGLTGGNTATFTPSAALAPSTTYTVDVSGATDTGGHVMSGHVTWTFTTAAAPASCCSVFAANATPGTPDSGDPGAVELGMRFTADTNGKVTAIKFYKGAGNLGTHTGTLWSATGAQLATVTFANETATGWQTANLTTPVNVTAGTTYIVSYHAPQGHYAVNLDAFTSAGIDNAPLHTPQSTGSAGNGLYLYGTGGFPNASYRGSNYWVDVVFTAGP